MEWFVEDVYLMLIIIFYYVLIISIFLFLNGLKFLYVWLCIMSLVNLFILEKFGYEGFEWWFIYNMIVLYIFFFIFLGFLLFRFWKRSFYFLFFLKLVIFLRLMIFVWYWIYLYKLNDFVYRWRYFMIKLWCMNGGYFFGIGKFEKYIIFLLVLMIVDL